MALLDDLVAVVRDLANEPDANGAFSDAKLIGILNDNDLDVNLAASEVWSQKASKLADLVDVSESGSSRKLGDLYKQALAMAEHYAGVSKAEETRAGRGTRIRSITRA